MHRPALLAALVVATALPLAAQVGHAPTSSPYRDIPFGKSVTVFYGDVGGDGGQIGVGPHNGRSYGVRFDIRLGAPLQFGLALARAETERFVVSADDSVAQRRSGPADERLTMIEGQLQLNITGRKSWHRLAPFIGGSIGFADASGLPSSVADSSDYNFGSKFYFVPTIGTRVFVTRSLHLRLEARQLFWRLKYPISYTLEPAAEPSTDPDRPNAVLPDGKREEWSGAREFRVGLGFSF